METKQFNLSQQRLLVMVFMLIAAVTGMQADNYITEVISLGTENGHGRDSHMAVGVIFYTHEDTVLVVGTKELGSHIYTDSIGTVSNVTNDVVSLCGAENTAAILSSGFHSPAVEAVKAFCSPVSGWVLPSAGELKALSRNLAVVSVSMKAIGGDAFTMRQYLSSSQDGSSTDSEKMYYYSVSLVNGFITSVLKTTEGCVRPVIRIR